MGFTDIAITLHTPDIVVLSPEQMCENLHPVTVFEVKTSVKWEHLGQIYRYGLYAPTYVVVPASEAEELKMRRYTMFQALKGLGIGLVALDTDREELKIILEPGKSLAIAEYTLYDAILWQVFRNLLKIPPQTFSRIYTVMAEFLQRELTRFINVDKIPTLGRGDKHFVKVIINTLSLQKKILPLAENPLTIEVLDPEVFKLTPEEFMKQVLLLKPLARITNFIMRVMLQKSIENILQQYCYIHAPLLLLYTKGLPLQRIGQPYDTICQGIYGDLRECYTNMLVYLKGGY